MSIYAIEKPKITICRTMLKSIVNPILASDFYSVIVRDWLESYEAYLARSISGLIDDQAFEENTIMELLNYIEDRFNIFPEFPKRFDHMLDKLTESMDNVIDTFKDNELRSEKIRDVAKTQRKQKMEVFNFKELDSSRLGVEDYEQLIFFIGGSSENAKGVVNAFIETPDKRSQRVIKTNKERLAVKLNEEFNMHRFIIDSRDRRTKEMYFICNNKDSSIIREVKRLADFEFLTFEQQVGEERYKLYKAPLSINIVDSLITKFG